MGEEVKIGLESLGREKRSKIQLTDESKVLDRRKSKQRSKRERERERERERVRVQTAKESYEIHFFGEKKSRKTREK